MEGCDWLMNNIEWDWSIRPLRSPLFLNPPRSRFLYIFWLGQDRHTQYLRRKIGLDISYIFLQYRTRRLAKLLLPSSPWITAGPISLLIAIGPHHHWPIHPQR